MVIWADNEPSQQRPGQLHVTFGLGANGDQINLYSPAGVLLDRVDFLTHRQTNDISQGRYPDAANGPYVYMTTPTPGAANVFSQGVNQPPNMLPIGDKYVVLGETLSFTVNATDPDPGQTLQYTGTGLPAGATLGLTSGLFQWTPATAPSSANINVTATDNGTPPRNANRSFAVHVSLPPQVVISRETGGINMAVPTVPGRQYQVRFKNALTDATWSPLGGPRTATGTSMEIPDTIGARSQRFYKIEVVPQ